MDVYAFFGAGGQNDGKSGMTSAAKSTTSSYKVTISQCKMQFDQYMEELGKICIQYTKNQRSHANEAFLHMNMLHLV